MLRLMDDFSVDSKLADAVLVVDEIDSAISIAGYNKPL